MHGIKMKQDIQQGLLVIRNTPLQCGSSPAELLMGRRLNDNIPRLPATLINSSSPKRNLVTERGNQKQQFDRKINQTSKVQTFQTGQKVAVQDHTNGEWSLRGIIIEETTPRSYTIRMQNGNILRRNRIHIRKLHSTTGHITNTLSNESQTTYPDDNTVDSDSDCETIPYDEEENEERDILIETTRSGRLIQKKHPVDYDDL